MEVPNLWCEYLPLSRLRSANCLRLRQAYNPVPYRKKKRREMEEKRKEEKWRRSFVKIKTKNTCKELRKRKIEINRKIIYNR